MAFLLHVGSVMAGSVSSTGNKGLPPFVNCSIPAMKKELGKG